jgi:hypothetical protein
VGRKPREICERIKRAHLAFAGVAGAEAVGDFGDHQLAIGLAVGGDDDVEQDLEPLAGKLGDDPVEQRAAKEEEAAHGVRERLARHDARKARGEGGAHLPAGGKTRKRTPLPRVARAHSDIGTLADLLQHLGQDGFVVLVVGVDHGDEFGRGRRHALDAGRGEAPPPDPVDAAHMGLLHGDGFGELGGAVGAVVVDDDHFERGAGKRGFELFDQRADVVALVEGGNDHRKGRRDPVRIEGIMGGKGSHGIVFLCPQDSSWLLRARSPQAAACNRCRAAPVSHSKPGWGMQNFLPRARLTRLSPLPISSAILLALSI